MTDRRFLKMILDELSRATGLGFLVSQAPILIFLMLYYREPQVTLFTARMRNETTLEVEVLSDQYGTATAYMLVSALGVVFSFMTAQMQESQVIDNMVEFSDELISAHHIWNGVLWIIFFSSHGLLIAQICSPVDTYFVALTVLTLTYTVQLMCAPRTQARKSDSIALIMFILMVGLVYGEMHSKHGLRLVMWTGIVMADILLVVGHAFDAQSNMETVANCRVFYCSFAILLLLVLYDV